MNPQKTVPYLFLLSIILLLFCQCDASKKTTQSNLTTATPATTIFLVRHAEKASEGGRNPVLTPEGEARANKLAQILSSANIQAVFSTDYIRTKSTAEPTAALYGLPTTIYNPRDTTFYRELLTSHLGQNILVVGHSNSTPAMVNRLLGDKRYESLDEKEYDKLFVLTGMGAQRACVVMTY